MSALSFYFHDYETFGTNPFRDRPSQFAGIRTDQNLNPIGEPDSFYCRMSEDYLPDIQACLITGIVPQQCERDGLSEIEFAARVHETLAMPGTCGLGYNSIRFDDEFTRNLLYRNFYDPYQREWQHGNSRWDLIDVVRLCYALRPEGIQWPEHEPGKPSFKLEDLASANQLVHTRAHDALSDVEATIGLAQLILKQQPRLFNYCLEKRTKKQISSLLNPATPQPVVHISSRFPAERGCLAVIWPICSHPSNPNGVIVYDLNTHPSELLDLDADEIHDRVFTPSADLPEGVERIPLKTIHINKAPVIAPLGVLKNVDQQRIKLNLTRCLEHLEQIKQVAPIAEKIAMVFTTAEFPHRDPEESIYAGNFLNQADKARLAELRTCQPHQLNQIADAFNDPRYPEMIKRYKARNFPQSLGTEETQKWFDFCRQRLQQQTESETPLWLAKLNEIKHLRQTGENEDKTQILDQLELFIRKKAEQYGLQTTP